MLVITSRSNLFLGSHERKFWDFSRKDVVPSGSMTHTETVSLWLIATKEDVCVTDL
jgi:hypothetical protein